jgi:large subunit ribosomal protein L21
MYAIIADGGRQYRVQEGQELEVDLRTASKGDEITFDRVLAVSSDEGLKLGQPLVDGATVTGQVLAVTQGEKIMVQKLRRRKNSRRRTGHRQMYTKVRIQKIATA